MPQPTGTPCSAPCGSRSSGDNGKAQRCFGSHKTLHKRSQKVGVPTSVKSRGLGVGKTPSPSRKNTIPIYGRVHGTAQEDPRALHSLPPQPGSSWIAFPAHSVLFAGWKRAAASNRQRERGVLATPNLLQAPRCLSPCSSLSHIATAPTNTQCHPEQPCTGRGSRSARRSLPASPLPLHFADGAALSQAVPAPGEPGQPQL